MEGKDYSHKMAGPTNETQVKLMGQKKGGKQEQEVKY